MLDAGTSLGPYEIVAPLGAGGMGEVYRAKDTRLDREVAVKVLPDRLASDATALSRFEREAKAVAAISHPNVLAVYDVGREGDTSYVVTELLDGETLRQRLQEGPIPYQKTLEIATAIADGLAAAHTRHIVHRDLKPENIFLTTDGVVKILDFGLARVSPQAETGGEDAAHTPTITLETSPGTIIGTLNYMAPEQIRGKPTDPRTDIFAFGCVLYEMLTGQRAFRGETSADTMTAILRETPTSVRAGRQHVGVELERVIVRCLEKKPEERFHSASDLSFTLKSMLADSGPVETGDASGRMWGFAVPVAAAAVLLLLVGAGLIFRAWPAAPAKAEASQIRSIAVLPFDDLSKGESQQAYVDAIWESITDDLAKISAIQVASSHAVRFYREKAPSMSEIQRELGVDAFVTGSALHAGTRIDLGVRLIRASDGRQIWSHHYEFDQRDILSEQRKIARAVADGIQIKLTPSEKDLLSPAPQIVPAAYQAYVQGMESLRYHTEGSCRNALDLFDQALKEDPNFALAYVGRARAYYKLANDFVAPREVMPLMQQAALKALEIDNTQSDAEVMLGMYELNYTWDFEQARLHFKRALDLRPSSAQAHLGYGLYLSATGHNREALHQLDAVQELDRATVYTDFDHGLISYMARDYDRCIRDASAALKVNENWWAAHSWLALAYSLRGDHDDALREARRSADLNNSASNRAMMGGVLAVAGERKEALAIYHKLKAEEPKQYVCPYELATIPLGLGDLDTAFFEMNRACDARADCIAWLNVDPRLDGIRDDPRFAKVLRRAGLEPLTGGLTVAKEETSGPTVVAVFPFDDNSPQHQPWLAAGLAQQISARLGRVNPEKVRVIGPESTAFYVRSDRPLSAAAVELHAGLVLRGAIQVIGNKVSITAKLIDPSNLTQVWSSTFDGTLNDPFALQRSVVEKIASGLPVELSGEETDRLQKRYTASPEAELAYMEGRFWWYQSSKDSFKKSIQNFEKAIKLDPNYALAYSGLADALTVFASWNANPASEIRERATQAARRAVALDDSVAETHTSVGIVAQFLDWDWDAAERTYQQAISLNTDYSLAHHMYGHLLVMLGRTQEALEQFKEAAQAEPLSTLNAACYGAVYAGTGDLAKGEQMLRKAIEWNSENGAALYYLGYVFELQGRFDKAIATYEKAVSLQPDNPVYLAVLGSAYASAGRMDDARRILKKLQDMSKTSFVGQMEFAKVYAGLGELDEAFKRLDLAYAGREPWLPQIRFEPGYSNLWKDPRFKALHERLGLKGVTLPKKRD